MTPPLATVGIAAIGEMGAGIAKPLSAHYNYKVLTNVSDRSGSTRQRARSASTGVVDADQDLVAQADYILTWEIIGGAPKLQPNRSWTTPRIGVSGPHRVDNAPFSGAHPSKVLNIKYIADSIALASGLKMCLLSTTKGLTVIVVQSFSTAHTLGVRPTVSTFKDYSSKSGELAAKGLVRMPPKAYRWVDEMEEIAKTSHTEGGFERHVFNRRSEVSRVVAHETNRGNEKTEDRRVGKTPEDVTKQMRQGLRWNKEKVA